MPLRFQIERLLFLVCKCSSFSSFAIADLHWSSEHVTDGCRERNDKYYTDTDVNHTL